MTSGTYIREDRYNKTHGWLYVAAGETRVTNQSATGFDLLVSDCEPTGTFRMFVSSTVDPTKRKFCTVTVTGLPRVQRIDIALDASKIYYSPDGSQTARAGALMTLPALTTPLR